MSQACFFQAEEVIRGDLVNGFQTCFFFFQAEDGIRDDLVTGVQTCALPISLMLIVCLKLNEHGYRVAYLNTQLALGLAPDNIISFFNQQFRWARGGFTMLLDRKSVV